MTGRKGPACDGCRLRKVRCHGNWPCTQCAHLNLRCHFSASAVRRRRRVRGGLVAELRRKEPEGWDRHHNNRNVTAAEIQNALPRQIDPCSADFFVNLLPEFSEFVFPLNPIISPTEMRDAIENMGQSNEDAALVNAFAAMTINRTRSSWTMDAELAKLMTNLIHDSMQAYRAVELDVDDLQGGTLGPLPVSIKRVLTSIFLSVCVLTLGRADRSFAILRECVAMLQIVNLDCWQPDDSKDLARWQRLYWEVYMHERHMALSNVSFRGALLPLEAGLPVVDASIPPHVDLGFRRLISLFLILDDTFVNHWHSQQGPGSSTSELMAEWIEHKQAQLDDDALVTAQEEKSMVELGLGGLSELQRIDLAITRLWLRILVWQLALSRGLLCSAPANEGLSLHFPVNSICKEFLSLFDRLRSVTSVGFHGMGMLQKLFEITSTIGEVLSLPIGPAEAREQERTVRVEDFMFLVQFLLSFSTISEEQRNYLNKRLQVLRNIYPMFGSSELITMNDTPFAGTDTS